VTDGNRLKRLCLRQLLAVAQVGGERSRCRQLRALLERPRSRRKRAGMVVLVGYGGQIADVSLPEMLAVPEKPTSCARIARGDDERAHGDLHGACQGSVGAPTGLHWRPAKASRLDAPPGDVEPNKRTAQRTAWFAEPSGVAPQPGQATN